MTLTQEYERMRPFYEDHDDRAVIFTQRRERSFDAQEWFIDRFLPHFDPHEQRLDSKRPIARKIKRQEWIAPEPAPEPEPKPTFSFPDTMLAPVAVFSGRCLCFCGAKAEYEIRNQLVCINHLQYQSEEYFFSHPEVRVFNQYWHMYFEYFRNIWVNDGHSFDPYLGRWRLNALLMT